MAIKTFSASLLASLPLSSKVRHFILRTEEQPPFDYQPGQFITLFFEKEGKTLRRSYSIANPPGQDNRIEFAAGYVDSGPGSEYLFALQPGDSLQISGPFGRLVLRENAPQRYILVATSTGVTPYRAMLPSIQQWLAEDALREVVLLQGVQYQQEVLYAEEFLALAAENPRFQFRACLSREKKAVLHRHERQGHVQAEFPSLALDPAKDLVYLCGNPSMIDESFAQLKEQGFASQQLVREKYISN